jgi:hypothetical protein
MRGPSLAPPPRKVAAACIEALFESLIVQKCVLGDWDWGEVHKRPLLRNPILPIRSCA